MSQALKRDYEIGDEIGRGRFGTVYHCTNRISGEQFAVKSIEKRSISGDSLDSLCLSTEPKILKLVSQHPNLISLKDLFEDEAHLHIVLDLCDSPDLHDRLAEAGKFSESESKIAAAQLIKAIAHCHRLGVAHRDLKPENILFDRRNGLRLGDFGSAETFGSRKKMVGVVGTPYYVAPEVLAGREYCEKADVWSAGVVIYVMIAGFPPFRGDSVAEIFEAVLRGNVRFPVRSFGSVSPAAKDLLRKMICKDVSRRLSAEQVLRHPWITSLGGQLNSD